MTRNISETQLVSIKTAGTKAFNNITQQFSKINRLGQSLRKNQNQWMNKAKNLVSLFGSKRKYERILNVERVVFRFSFSAVAAHRFG